MVFVVVDINSQLRGEKRGEKVEVKRLPTLEILTELRLVGSCRPPRNDGAYYSSVMSCPSSRHMDHGTSVGSATCKYDFIF